MKFLRRPVEIFAATPSRLSESDDLAKVVRVLTGVTLATSRSLASAEAEQRGQ